MLSLVSSPGKLRWNLPQCKTVLFDRVYKSEFSEILGGDSMQVFDPRYEDLIYIKPFAKGVLLWLRLGFKPSLTVCYFVSFLKSAAPLQVITAADNNADLYQAIELLGNGGPRFAIVQNGVRTQESLPAVSTNEKIIVIALTQAQGELFTRHAPHMELHALGSLPLKLLLNETTSPLKQGSAAFISQWRPGLIHNGKRHLRNHRGDLVKHDIFFAPEHLRLPTLRDALKMLGQNFYVLGASETNPQEEEDFYSEILGNNDWEFSPRQRGSRSYGKLNDYRIVFGVDSTLAYEALVSSSRVMFLPTHEGASFSSVRMQFGYPQHEFLRDHVYLLKCGGQVNWEKQIAEVLSLPDLEICEATEMVLGSRALSSSYEDFAKILRTPS